jgi:hypothetical protein
MLHALARCGAGVFRSIAREENGPGVLGPLENVGHEFGREGEMTLIDPALAVESRQELRLFLGAAANPFRDLEPLSLCKRCSWESGAETQKRETHDLFSLHGNGVSQEAAPKRELGASAFGNQC